MDYGWITLDKQCLWVRLFLFKHITVNTVRRSWTFCLFEVAALKANSGVKHTHTHTHALLLEDTSAVCSDLDNL